MFRRPGPYRQIRCQRQRSTAPGAGLRALSSSCERAPRRLVNSEGEAWESTLEVDDGGVKLRRAVEGFWTLDVDFENQKNYVTSQRLMVAD